jgi:hypothetical protein
MVVMAAGLFVGYVGLLIVAGAWGAFGPAHLDQRWLFDLDVDSLDGGTSTDLLSQYRFMRGIELGFGVLSAVYWREILNDPRFGRPFLGVMGLACWPGSVDGSGRAHPGRCSCSSW